jgi:DNA-binding transcriptional ArsR family regulator
MPEHYPLRDHRLNGEADIPMIASLLADDARATMLLALHADGVALSTSALAGRARIGLPAASAHLARLAVAGLVCCERQGRSRVYRLAGPDVAHAIEALGAIAPIRPARTLNESSQLAALRIARTCYDHLAGRLGVVVFDAFVAHDALQELTVSSVPARRTHSGLGSVRLGQRAESVMEQFGIDVREPLGAAACLDWTESRPHLSGPLGAALCTRMLEQGWVLHRPNTRAVRVTEAGRAGLRAMLDLDLDLDLD